jgi:hypothetical protein
VGKIKQTISVILLSALFLQICSSSIYAKPVTALEAEQAAKGWLNSDASPYIEQNRDTLKVQTFTDDSGQPLYFIVSLQPTGFVIVSADDLVEPIIGFSDNGTYDALSNNPLSELVTLDVPSRTAAAKQTGDYQILNTNSQASENFNKWNKLITIGQESESGFELMALASNSMGDIRVSPLIKSKWSQETSCLSNPQPCYNYYTPNQYPCGCVATVMTQLMRYHKYPVDAVNKNTFEIKIDGQLSQVSLLRGSGVNGAYDWNAMPLDPNCSTTLTQRMAIGAICYDAGLTVNMNYSSAGSGADVYKTKDALKNVFKFGQAIVGYNSYNNIGAGLINMINPNLDAGDPVILAITRPNGGHAVLCDGYGYSSDTMYHHLNMGWAGISDAWYNLPDVNAIDRTYNSVVMCLYNIHTVKTGDGEVVSGRVLDYNDKPVADVNVYAESFDKQTVFSARTNANGIYAFNSLKSSTTYSIQPDANGLIYTEQTITTGKSINDRPVSGNTWAVDFKASCAGDFDGDGDIDEADFIIFVAAWNSKPQDKNWNPLCDLNNPPDNIINSLDLKVFLDNWLKYSK